MNRQARDLPFGKSIFKTTRPITPLTERRDGLERQDAPRAPAIRYNLSIRRKLRQPPFQLRQRYIQRPGQMALLELVRGTDIEDCRRPGSQAIQQLDAGDRLQPVTGAEVGCHDAGDFGAAGGQPAFDPSCGQSGAPNRNGRLDHRLSGLILTENASAAIPFR